MAEIERWTIYEFHAPGYDGTPTAVKGHGHGERQSHRAIEVVPAPKEAAVMSIERDRSAMRFAISVVRGIEEEYPDLAGVREGEATSDVLAAILVRLERDSLNGGGDAR